MCVSGTYLQSPKPNPGRSSRSPLHTRTAEEPLPPSPSGQLSYVRFVLREIGCSPVSGCMQERSSSPGVLMVFLLEAGCTPCGSLPTPTPLAPERGKLLCSSVCLYPETPQRDTHSSSLRAGQGTRQAGGMGRPLAKQRGL